MPIEFDPIQPRPRRRTITQMGQDRDLVGLLARNPGEMVPGGALGRAADMAQRTPDGGYQIPEDAPEDVMETIRRMQRMVRDQGLDAPPRPPFNPVTPGQQGPSMNAEFQDMMQGVQQETGRGADTDLEGLRQAQQMKEMLSNMSPEQLQQLKDKAILNLQAAYRDGRISEGQFIQLLRQIQTQDIE